MIVFVAPYPPSANRYLRHTARGTYRTAEADRYRDQVRLAAFRCGAQAISGPVSLRLVLHAKTTKTGKASKTVLDLDNCCKVAVDALQGVLYANDKQIARIEISRGDPIAGGGLLVAVRAMADEI